MDPVERLSPPAGRAAAGSALERDPASPFLYRFAVSTRALHWLVAIPVLLLLLTGLTNFWPEAKALHVGGARIFGWLHVLLGLIYAAALLPSLLAVLSRREARRDARELLTFRLDDYLWLQHRVLRAAGLRSVGPRVGKFNAGQKVNAVLSTAAAAILMGTGVVLGVNYWDKALVDVDLAAALFRWHTLFSLLLIPLVAGHLYMAVINPGTRESLRAVTSGRVLRSWAERHHGAWAERAAGEDRARGGGDPSP